ncbi:MAG: DUF4388 domain-containing protein [Candidatus Aminicenantes bacterium]|nr:DUF4388 domain-containing protein [Candidatus Aminicenantes bacterium]
MKDAPLEGTLAATPFPRVLFDLWTRERTGRLRLRREDEERILHFEKGRLCLARESFSERDFLAALVRKKVLLPGQAESAERLASLKGFSLLKALGEAGALSPIPLWSLLASFFVRQLFPLFDREEGTFDFEPVPPLPAEARLGHLEVPDLILQGVRQMQNDSLIERFLPPPAEAFRLSAPYFLQRLDLEPYERYALSLLGEVPNLQSFRARAELGERESRKALFAFACLGLLGLAAPEAAAGPPAGPPVSNPERLTEAFNEKCAFVFKYLSKEAGPVAQSILGKALDEAKSALGPAFQRAALLSDGRIELETGLRLGAGSASAEVRRSTLRGFDEILTAEVLAVRKSLGPAHETAVVKGLEKVGCH